MKLNDVFGILQEVAPVKLSDEFCKTYSAYDNSGIIVNCGGDIKGAVFALDLSEKVLNRAVKLGYNLIVTHHPAIFGGIKRLDTVNDPQAYCLTECAKLGISVISMHLNFDAAPKGIDYYLMRGLGGENAEILSPVQGGGYGRVYSVPAQSFGDYAKYVKKEFSSDRILFYGDRNKKIERVASFCGAGCDEKAIAFAKAHGADALASADMKHHEIIALLNNGINVIHMTHYASENYGFYRIYSDIKSKQSFKVPSEYYNEEELS